MPPIFLSIAHPLCVVIGDVECKVFDGIGFVAY